jgi:adenylate cyclase
MIEIGSLKTIVGEQPLVDKDALLAMIEWISDKGCEQEDERLFIAGLGERLYSFGFPIDRLTFHVMTLHPDYVGRTVAWAPDETVEVLDREQGAVPLFSRTPLYKVMKTGCSLVIDTGDEDDGWQDIDVFADRQLAQMIIAPLGKGAGPVSVIAFGTARVGGFLPSQCQVIDRMLPALRNAWELQALRLEDLSLIGD